MNRIEQKKVCRERRKKRVRRRVFGTADCPRLSVFRSLKNIYVQLINDEIGQTLAEASTRSAELKDAYGGNKTAAVNVGKLLGERARAKGITRAAFDRNGYRFHGRLKALAEAVREAGLKI